jgi:hypothetical protein
MDSRIIKDIQKKIGCRGNFPLYCLAKYVEIWL